MNVVRCLLLLLAALLSASAQAADPEVEAFYKGRQIRLITARRRGRGSICMAGWWRGISRVSFPGKPQIIPGNLPGAGSMRAVQSLRAEPKDGSYIVLFNPGQIMATVLTPAAVQGLQVHGGRVSRQRQRGNPHLLCLAHDGREDPSPTC